MKSLTLKNLFNEAAELTEKIDHLADFKRSVYFQELPLVEQELLNKQHDIIIDYLNILIVRINYMSKEL